MPRRRKFRFLEALYARPGRARPDKKRPSLRAHLRPSARSSMFSRPSSTFKKLYGGRERWRLVKRLHSWESSSESPEMPTTHQFSCAAASTARALLPLFLPYHYYSSALPLKYHPHSLLRRRTRAWSSPAGRGRRILLRRRGEPRRGGGDLPGALWYDDYSTTGGLNAPYFPCSPH